MSEDKKVLLSLKDVEVKFNVRGRVLQAIRGVSLDIYENESIAIVGESGSGKSVLTKTFSGMLDSNGFISNGDIILSDDELSKTDVKIKNLAVRIVRHFYKKLYKATQLKYGANIFKKMASCEDKEELAKLKEEYKKATDVKISEEEDKFAKNLAKRIYFSIPGNIHVNKIIKGDSLIKKVTLAYQNGEKFPLGKEYLDFDFKLTDELCALIRFINFQLNRYTKYESGSDIYKQIQELKLEKLKKESLTEEEVEAIDKKIADLHYEYVELFNLKQTLDFKKDKEQIKEISLKMKAYQADIKKLENDKKDRIKSHKKAIKSDLEYMNSYKGRLAELKAQYKQALNDFKLSDEQFDRNARLAKEIFVSVGRYGLVDRLKFAIRLCFAFKNAMVNGLDLFDEQVVNEVFDKVAFRVKYLGTDEDNVIKGYAIVNLAKIKYSKDWGQIRGRRIATVFQDPMTSLNPIVPIGQQIMNVILKHQKCSKNEAKERAIDLMTKVGIPNAEKRFSEYPFQYSGGMRQRIVIAIALSCQPKILICDEPTTALDVTIQAQIIDLIKNLQKELHFTTIYITHDLGVVASVSDRVAILYAGQVVEYGTVEEIFYDPRHPYTWALLSSLPQLSVKGEKLYSISGTPPSLYNKIVGDPFAPRNPYCMAIDLVKEPPYFQISESHFAKTWLLDPRAPKVEKPEIIKDIHKKLENSYINMEEV